MAAAWNSVDYITEIARWTAVVSFPLIVLYAIVSDFRALKIPNWASICIAATFLPAALLGGIDPAAMAIHYGTGAALLAAGTVLFVRGIVGGGVDAAACGQTELVDSQAFVDIVQTVQGVQGADVAVDSIKICDCHW